MLVVGASNTKKMCQEIKNRQANFTKLCFYHLPFINNQNIAALHGFLEKQKELGITYDVIHFFLNTNNLLPSRLEYKHGFLHIHEHKERKIKRLHRLNDLFDAYDRIFYSLLWVKNDNTELYVYPHLYRCFKETCNCNDRLIYTISSQSRLFIAVQKQVKEICQGLGLKFTILEQKRFLKIVLKDKYDNKQNLEQLYDKLVVSDQTHLNDQTILNLADFVWNKCRPNSG